MRDRPEHAQKADVLAAEGHHKVCAAWSGQLRRHTPLELPLRCVLLGGRVAGEACLHGAHSSAH